MFSALLQLSSCRILHYTDKHDRGVIIVKPIDINAEPSMLDFVKNYRNNHFLPEKNKDESPDAFLDRLRWYCGKDSYLHSVGEHHPSIIRISHCCRRRRRHICCAALA